MRLIVAGLLVMTLSACAPTHRDRVGAIVVQPFSLEQAKISDPVDLNPELTANLARMLHKYILDEIKEQPGLALVDSCETGDYSLTGRFDEMRVHTDYDGVFRRRSQREFKFEVNGVLARCDTGEVVKTFDVDEDDQDVSNLLDNLAQKVVDEIKSERIPPEEMIAKQ